MLTGYSGISIVYTTQEMKVLTDEKRKTPTLQYPKNLHYLAVWTKSDTF
jgi:hypothetical protein